MTNDLPSTSSATAGPRAPARILKPTVILSFLFLGALGAGFGCGAADEPEDTEATEKGMGALEGGRPGEIRRDCVDVRRGVKRCGWYVCETASGVALPRRDPNDPYNKRPDPLTASCSWVPLTSPDPVDAVYCCRGQRTDSRGKTVYTGCTKFSNPETGRVGKNRCGQGVNFAQVLEVECANTSSWDTISGDVSDCT